MKKLISILSVLLIIILALTLSACGKDGKDGVDGKDGDTPTITISEDGYWVINGEITSVKATSEDVVDVNPQGLQFFLQDDGTYLVACGDAKYLSNIVIPETYRGGLVVGIAKDGFSDCRNLVSITIPATVINIDEHAFSRCVKLASITIPDSVRCIGESAFSGCFELRTIVIGNGVTDIGRTAFDSCYSIEEIYFNAIAMNDLGYEDKVFACAGQSTDGVKVVIGKDVTKIPAYLFGFYVDFSWVHLVPKITSVIFEKESACTIINYGAFQSCKELTSVVIPDSVTTIGSNAFDGCQNLTNIYYTGSELDWLEIDIDDFNDYCFEQAIIHYNYIIE